MVKNALISEPCGGDSLYGAQTRQGWIFISEGGPQGALRVGPTKVLLDWVTFIPRRSMALHVIMFCVGV